MYYVLLELQSTVDYQMPFRLLMYMVGIWQEIYKNMPEKERERSDFRLPAIIPAVLYNGTNNWTAAVHFKEILDGYREFEKHVLDFRYILFDVNRYSEEELYKAANLVSVVFALDQKYAPEEIIDRLRAMAGVLKGFSRDEYNHLVGLLKNAFIPRMPGYIQEEVRSILEESNPQEVDIMISNLGLTLDEMKKQAEEKGKEEGERKSKVEVAQNALKKGMSVNVVVEITGLSQETVQKIKKQIED